VVEEARGRLVQQGKGSRVGSAYSTAKEKKEEKPSIRGKGIRLPSEGTDSKKKKKRLTAQEGAY